MDNALLVGLSRQVALGRELEVVANNIANINTTGYKSDSSIFEKFLMPEASSGEFPAGSRDVAYVRDRTTWHNLSAGPILRTGGPLALLEVRGPRPRAFHRAPRTPWSSR